MNNLLKRATQPVDIVMRAYYKLGMFRAVKAAQKIGWTDEEIQTWVREMRKQ